MQKLANLRKLMEERNLDGYIITGNDPHMNGYVAHHWRTREWFCGFSGSAGTIIITPDTAGLWTDGRYFIQAQNELHGSGVTLFKIAVPDEVKPEQFLADNMPENARIGFDGRTMSAAQKKGLFGKLKDPVFVMDSCLIDELWSGRPAMPFTQVYEHAPNFAGAATAEKLTQVRKKMGEEKVDAYLVCALDEAAWLLNIRAADLPNSPLAYAFLFITQDEAHVFADTAAMAEVAGKLTAQGYTLHDYIGILPFLAGFADASPKKRLYFNKGRTNAAIESAAAGGFEPAKAKDIISHIKAVKTPCEIQNIRQDYIFESAVITQVLHMIKTTDFGAVPKTESDIADMLTDLRKKSPNYICDSFPTIAAFGANAALSHYRAEGAGAAISNDGFLLIDTGGQYLGATTDTTRTCVLAPPTPTQKREFTLVLRAHIALSRAVFLKATTGSALDAIARVPLWEYGYNYQHGTGHGIGYCLNVHEGPQNISQRHVDVALEPGMLLSNEPALYREGVHGIRTENVLLVTHAAETHDGTFYKFEPITFCPYDVDAIDRSLLTADEIAWLNEYHSRVYSTICGLLPQECARWLYGVTRAIY